MNTFRFGLLLLVVSCSSVPSRFCEGGIREDLVAEPTLESKKSRLLLLLDAYQEQFVGKAIRAEGTTRQVASKDNPFGGSPSESPDTSLGLNGIQFEALLDASGRSWESSRTTSQGRIRFEQYGVLADRTMSVQYNGDRAVAATVSCERQNPVLQPNFQAFHGIRVACFDLQDNFGDIDPSKSFLTRFVAEASDIDVAASFDEELAIALMRSNGDVTERCFLRVEPVVHCVGYERNMNSTMLTKVSIDYADKGGKWLPKSTTRMILSRDHSGSLSKMEVRAETTFSKFELVNLPPDDEFLPKIAASVPISNRCEKLPKAIEQTESNFWVLMAFSGAILSALVLGFRYFKR